MAAQAVSPAETTNAGDPGAALPGGAGRCGPCPGLALRRCLAPQRLRAAGDRPGALLGRAQRQPGLDLLGARAGQGVRGGVPDPGVRLVVDGFVLGDREPLLGGLQREQRIGALRLDRVAPRPQPLGLGVGRPYGLLQPAQPGRGGARPPLRGRTGLPHRVQVGQARRLFGPRALQRRPQPGQLLLDAVAGRHRLVHRGLHVQRARPGAGATRGPPGREHVALDGDGREAGGGHDARGVQVVHDHDAVQRPAQRRGQHSGRADQLRGPPAGRRGSLGAADRHGSPRYSVPTRGRPFPHRSAVGASRRPARHVRRRRRAAGAGRRPRRPVTPRPRHPPAPRVRPRRRCGRPAPP